MAKTIGDEFLDIFDSRQKENMIEDAMSIGTVTNIEPLIIKIDNLDLYENNFTINPYLKEWEEIVNITTSTNNEHSHTISKIVHPSKLKIGTKVFCYGNEYDTNCKSYQHYAILEVIS
ncbi:DUF2577 family protein [Clostridium butyricum]|uniref:DUF2577 family protein n=1 Tax=Clostridium butyricum TaxID=1492 RepID=UPI00325B625E